MAIGISLLDSGTCTTTASLDFSPIKLYTVVVSSLNSSSLTANLSISGGGLTWVKEYEIGIAHPSVPTVVTTLAVFSAYDTGATGTLSISGASSTCYIVAQIDSATEIIQITHSSGTGTTYSVTLNAFLGTNNGAFGAFASIGTTVNVTPGSGFTELIEVDQVGTQTLELEYKKTSDTSVDATAGSSSWVGIAFETDFVRTVYGSKELMPPAHQTLLIPSRRIISPSSRRP